LEHQVHPWSSFVVLPLFALANAGIVISSERLRIAIESPLAIGIVLGLVVGKVIGITGGSWIALRFGGRPAVGVGRREIVAVGLLGGIGFTVSLFVAGLSFSGPDLAIAKLAILMASLIAAAAAWLLLRTVPADVTVET
jgi:Na+/H+ antiporter NhaA